MFRLIYESDKGHDIRIGRFENLREETLRLFEETGTPVTMGIYTYLKESAALNSSQRPCFYFERYGPELERLVADKDKYLIDRFDYKFSMAEVEVKHPKTN